MSQLKRRRLCVEILEDRCVPANSITLNGTVLSIVADPLKSHVAMVLQQTPGITQVVLDDVVHTINTPVTQVDYHGGTRNNLFLNSSTIAGTLTFGNGDDVIYSNAPGQVINAGNGRNYIQALGGGSTINSGFGEDNIQGGGGDVINPGRGQNVVYDVVGVNTINLVRNNGRDFVFTNASSTVTGAQAIDRVAYFFADNRQAGSGTLVLENGVLYFTGNDNGNHYTAKAFGNRLVVTYDLNDGAGPHTETFRRSDVHLLANFGGAGDDRFVNNTAIADVQVGAGGSNFIVGGFGLLSMGKAGESAGNSVVVGRSNHYNDVSGSGAADATSVLIVNPHSRRNVVHSNNAGDTVFGMDRVNDVFVSPYSLVYRRMKSGALPPAPEPPPSDEEPPQPSPNPS